MNATGVTRGIWMRPDLQMSQSPILNGSPESKASGWDLGDPFRVFLTGHFPWVPPTATVGPPLRGTGGMPRVTQ